MPARTPSRVDPVLPFVLTGRMPLILLASLLGMLYLTWLDLRDEPGVQPQVKLWWALLVLLLNVVGYAALRIWLALRRRRDGERRPAGRA
jgi:hypothetical protein